jgi:hypothetical protein
MYESKRAEPTQPNKFSYLFIYVCVHPTPHFSYLWLFKGSMRQSYDILPGSRINRVYQAHVLVNLGASLLGRCLVTMLRGWPIFPRFSPCSGQRYGHRVHKVRWNACTRPNYAVQLPLPHARAASSRPTAASITFRDPTGFIALALMTSSETKCSSRSSNEMRVTTRVIFSFFRRKSRAFRFLHSETEQCNLHARVQQMLAHRLLFFWIMMLYHLKIIKNYTP